MSEERSDASELAAVAQGLAAHLRRRAWLGAEKELLAVDRASTKEVVPAPAPTRSRPSQLWEPEPDVAALPPAREVLSPAGVENRTRAQACTDLAALRALVAGCTACSLCKTRTQTVFSDGTAPARVMFVGEAPGFHEDQQGVPFVGKAGELLTDIITKGMGLARADVYIANVLKCRPPDNRDPSPEEKHLCTPWLDRQIELVDPLVLVPLGRHAANHVLGTESSLSKLRGRVHERGGRRIVPTFHPAYLLRNPASKRDCWADIQLAMGALGIPVPARKPDPAG